MISDATHRTCFLFGVASLLLATPACGDGPDASAPAARASAATKPAPIVVPTAAPATATATAAPRPAKPLRTFCTEPERDAATAEIAKLDERMRALDSTPGANGGAALSTQVDTLLQGPCFKLADPLHSPFDSGVAARSWWERGGKLWLENNVAYQADREQTYVVQPSVLPTLASDLEGASKSPVAPLLCPTGAAMPGATAACGQGTSGWLLRAQQALHGASAEYHTRDTEHPPCLRSREECERVALEESREARFVKYAACVDQLPPEVDALPLGRYQAPEGGWLIVRGPRATRNACDEIRAYELTTGAAYIARECSRNVTTEVGRMPVDATREAMLIAFLAPFAKHYATTNAVAFKLPKEIPALADSGRQGHGRGGGISDVTSLELAWIRKQGGQARVTLTWPHAFWPALTHAAHLLAIAESGFVPGKCAPARLPNIKWDALGPHVENHEQHDRTSSPALLRAFESLHASACPGAK